MHGGSLTLSAPGYSRAHAAVLNNLTISGGLLKASNKSSDEGTPNELVCVRTETFTMSGGTLSFPSMYELEVPELKVSGTADITGGNVNNFYNGNEVNGRTLTKLYMVDDSGAPTCIGTKRRKKVKLYGK